MNDPFEDVSTIDRLKIMDAVARYSWAIDSGKLAEYLDCFTLDATLRHPLRDGSPGVFSGRAGIEGFIAPSFSDRARQGYGHQHQFSAIRIAPEGEGLRVDAYALIVRHDFQRQYWPRGSSFRMGTWHALYAPIRQGWKIADLDIRMWTDSAFETGIALLDRPPGMPGIRD